MVLVSDTSAANIGNYSSFYHTVKRLTLLFSVICKYSNLYYNLLYNLLTPG